MLDESRRANRLLSAEVVTLEKKQPKRQKTSKVCNTGLNTDTVSASASCLTTCRHLIVLQSEFRSLRSQLLRETPNFKPKKKKGSLARVLQFHRPPRVRKLNRGA